METSRQTQSDLAVAQTELSSSRARLAEAERALATDTSAAAWKIVTASREASDKAATRVRVLETMSAEASAAAEAKEKAERDAATAVALSGLAPVENTPAATDEDLAEWEQAILTLRAVSERITARVSARRTARLEADRCRRALGQPERGVITDDGTTAFLAAARLYFDRERTLPTPGALVTELQAAVRLGSLAQTVTDSLVSKRASLERERSNRVRAHEEGLRREVERRTEAFREAGLVAVQRAARYEAARARVETPPADKRITAKSLEENFANAADLLREANADLEKERAALASAKTATADNVHGLGEIEEQIAAWAKRGGA